MQNDLKILDPNSLLHFLPKDMNQEQLMIYDSLRFTLEMLDYNYQQLIVCLTNVSLQREQKVHFKAFHYAWAIVDHVHSFTKLYEELDAPLNGIFNDIKYVKDFRDTIQHISTSLRRTATVKLLENKRPIYGMLKWVANDKPEPYTCVIVSGIFNVNGLSFTQHAKDGYVNFINEIILETDNRKNRKVNTINLSKLHNEITGIVRLIDQDLTDFFESNNLALSDWKSVKDVVIKVKNG